MGTATIQLPPQCWVPKSANGAQFTVVDGSNFPVLSLAYDGGSTDESAFAYFRATGYASGNITVSVDWYHNGTATSGNVVWGAQVAVITPNSDSQDIETDAFDTAATTQDAHIGTTAQRLHTCDVTVTAVDSLAAGDWVCLHLYRDASDTTNDTLAGDANVVMVTVSYTTS